MTGREHGQGTEQIEHRPGCHLLRAHPTEGDEAALCDCGVHEEGYVKWLEAQAERKEVPGG